MKAATAGRVTDKKKVRYTGRRMSLSSYFFIFFLLKKNK